jgi:hypothetical protein
MVEDDSGASGMPENGSGEYASTLKLAAAALGITFRAVERYAAAAGLEKGARGWPLAPLRAIRDARRSELARTPDGARLLAARADERTAKARLAELEFRIRSGDFIPRDEMKARDITRIAIVKRGLFAFARSLPPRLEGLTQKEMELVITRAVRDLLTRFASL